MTTENFSSASPNSTSTFSLSSSSLAATVLAALGTLAPRARERALAPAPLVLAGAEDCGRRAVSGLRRLSHGRGAQAQASIRRQRRGRGQARPACGARGVAAAVARLALTAATIVRVGAYPCHRLDARLQRRVLGLHALDLLQQHALVVRHERVSILQQLCPITRPLSASRRNQRCPAPGTGHARCRATRCAGWRRTAGARRGDTGRSRRVQMGRRPARAARQQSLLHPKPTPKSTDRRVAERLNASNASSNSTWPPRS